MVLNSSFSCFSTISARKALAASKTPAHAPSVCPIGPQRPASHLRHIQLVVVALLRHELIVRAALGDAALVDVHDLVAVLDRGETVRDDERSPALKHRVEALLQCFFRLNIDT